MEEDLQDELMRVKARESRYKKEAQERIAALERELEDLRLKEKSDPFSLDDAAASGENDANGELQKISRLDGKLRDVLELSRKQQELVLKGKENLRESFVFFTPGESFENALREVEKINGSQAALMAEILAEIGKADGMEKNGVETFAMLPYLALACKIAAAKVQEAGEIIRQTREPDGLAAIMGSWYGEQADALIAVNEYLASLLGD